MKTSGGLNFFHYLAWLNKHREDAATQALMKAKLPARKLERKLKVLYRRSLRKARAKPAKAKDEEELQIPGTEAKFPINLGVAFARFDPQGPTTVKGVFIAPAWKRFGYGDLAAIENWKDDLGRWHAGYPSGVTNKNGKTKPEFFPDGKDGGPDMRFYEGSFTLPAWDSFALSDACKAGEVSPSEFDDLLLRLLVRLTDGRLEELVSCKGERRMILVGLGVHPQDGTLHVHPLFLKAEPLFFVLKDGRCLPADKAPKGGRRGKDEGWEGGNRLGKIGKGGKLVANPLGPAGVAASAMRDEGIPPGLEHGANWDLHDFMLESRRGTGRDGKKSKLKGQADRARDESLGESYDDYGSRVFREEVRALAERNAAFKARRAKKIKEAVAAQEAANLALIKAVAGKEIERLEAENSALRGELKSLAESRSLEPTTFDPEKLEMWVTNANADAQAGYGLSRMPEEALGALVLRPDGSVGLNKRALKFLDDGIRQAEIVIGSTSASEEKVKVAQERLVVFRSVLATIDAIGGVDDVPYEETKGLGDTLRDSPLKS